MSFLGDGGSVAVGVIMIMMAVSFTVFAILDAILLWRVGRCDKDSGSLNIKPSQFTPTQPFAVKSQLYFLGITGTVQPIKLGIFFTRQS